MIDPIKAKDINEAAQIAVLLAAQLGKRVYINAGLYVSDNKANATHYTKGRAVKEMK